MSKGSRLLIEGFYDAGIEQLAKEAAKDRTDDFCCGPICDLGVGYLLSGQFERAVTHFQELQKKAFATCSLHRIYEGIGKWHLGERRESIRIWMSGAKCGYHVGGLRTLDVPFVLLYAHSRDKRLITRREVTDQIKNNLSQIVSTSFAFQLAKFLIGEISSDDVSDFIETTAAQSHPNWQVVTKCQFHFYEGLQHAIDGDESQFHKSMQQVIASPRLKDLLWEFVFASLECRHTRSQQRRQ
jgi:hypothetical protein